MLTNPPVSYDLCVGVPISRRLTESYRLFSISVLNVKVLVGAFNFQPGEGDSRGLLCYCTTSPINRLQH